MRKGDLVIIISSPWEKRSLFGYENGDVAVVLETFPYPDSMSLPSVRIYVFTSSITVTVPILYVEKIGE